VTRRAGEFPPGRREVAGATVVIAPKSAGTVPGIVFAVSGAG